MKKLLILLALVTSILAYDQSNITAKCDKVLVRSAYTTCYSYTYTSALYSVYTLDNKIDITAPRLETFYTDKDVPIQYRTANSQFTSTGYDKGHLFPASNGDWSANSRIETNLLSNIVAQDPNLNRNGSWRDTERGEQSIEHTYGTIYVVSGAIYDGKKIKSGLSIPKTMYKIIIVPKVSKMAIILYPNVSVPSYDLSKMLTDEKTISSMTGIKFNLPKYTYFTAKELQQFIK